MNISLLNIAVYDLLIKIFNTFLLTYIILLQWSPEYYGEFLKILSVISIANIVLTSIAENNIYHISNHRTDNKEINYSITYSITTSLLYLFFFFLFIILFFFFEFSLFIKENIFILIFIFIANLFDVFSNISISLFRINNKYFKYLRYIRYIQLYKILIVIILVSFFNARIIDIAYTQLFISILFFFYAFYRNSFFELKFSLFNKKIFNFIKLLLDRFLLNTSSVFKYSTELLILSFFFSNKELVAIVTTLTLARAGIFFISIIKMFYNEKISLAFSKKNFHELNVFYLNFKKNCTVLFIAILFFFILYAEKIYLLFTHDLFVFDSLFFFGIYCSLVIHIMWVINFYIFDLTNNIKKYSKYLFIFNFFHFLNLFVLIYFFDTYGIVISFLFYEVTILLFSVLFLKKNKIQNLI